MDLRKQEPGSEVMVYGYVELNRRMSFSTGHLIRIQESNPRTGALEMEIRIPQFMRDTHKESREWKSFELNGEDVEILGRFCKPA